MSLISCIKKKEENPPYEYDFLLNLNEKEYPKYLAKIFEFRTGKKLSLSYKLKMERGQLKINSLIDKNKCKTFNEKIQWLKLYDNSDLKRKCTDKLTVRDYVAQRIGTEYLKPVLQVCNSFDEIDFNSLPEQFVMKCSHGCKWQFIIRDKRDFLQNKRMFNDIRKQMNGWMEQEFWCWEGFELQYKDLEHKILIEELIKMQSNRTPKEYEIYCFSGVPKIFINVRYEKGREICYFDENFNYIDLILHPDGRNRVVKMPVDETLKQIVELSGELSKEFKFVRVDFMVTEGETLDSHNVDFNGEHSTVQKIHFEELTFSPYSGLIDFDEKWNRTLGDWIEL